ncbi:MAG: FAD:protein FMN transferase [Chitinophagales bacterium]
MKRFLFLLYIPILAIIGCNSPNQSSELHTYTEEANHMGTVFQITALGENEDIAKDAVKSAYEEVERIEKLISSWDENSETSLINRNAGIRPVKVSEELFNLIDRSKKVSKLTNGVFDISFASIDKIWHFDGTMTEIPTAEAIANSVAKINYEHIILNYDSLSVFLKDEGMKIGFGGIGKGYTANRCKTIMLENGIMNGVVNAGGDLITWGKQSNGEDWTIGIADPSKKESALSYLNINDQSVVTSGNYERFIEIDGKKYCHIIDPRTGWPAESLNSVTIICSDAEIGDALATSVFILGVDEGLALINQLQDIECFIVDEQDSLFYSNGVELEYSND